MEVINTIADVFASSKDFFEGFMIGGWIVIIIGLVMLLLDKKFDIFD